MTLDPGIWSECVALANGDTSAALEAAYFLSSISPAQVQQVLDNKARIAQYTNEFGLSQLACIPLSIEEVRQADTYRQTQLLGELSSALTTMPHTKQDAINAGAALAMEEGGSWYS